MGSPLSTRTARVTAPLPSNGMECYHTWMAVHGDVLKACVCVFVTRGPRVGLQVVKMVGSLGIGCKAWGGVGRLWGGCVCCMLLRCSGGFLLLDRMLLRLTLLPALLLLLPLEPSVSSY